MFESPMDLHYSQTNTSVPVPTGSLNPLWIYTTLKQNLQDAENYISLNPLWIYTTLKPVGFFNFSDNEFESPMDLHYSQTLIMSARKNLSLNPLWIYTTLKPAIHDRMHL